MNVEHVPHARTVQSVYLLHDNFAIFFRAEMIYSLSKRFEKPHSKKWDYPGIVIIHFIIWHYVFGNRLISPLINQSIR